MVSLGNEYGESTDSFFISSENRNSGGVEMGDLHLFANIEGCYKGKVIQVPPQFSSTNQMYIPFIKFIRAAYRRSAAISDGGQVFVWGTGFRNEKLSKPNLIFHDKNGIRDL